MPRQVLLLPLRQLVSRLMSTTTMMMTTLTRMAQPLLLALRSQSLEVEMMMMMKMMTTPSRNRCGRPPHLTLLEGEVVVGTVVSATQRQQQRCQLTHASTALPLAPWKRQRHSQR